MNAKPGRALAVVLAIVTAGWAAEPQRASLPADFFPYGAMHMSTISHWQHYLPPIDEYVAYLDKDLARMKEIGCNSLAAHVDWYDIEPAEGEFNFERLDRIMDLVEKHGLKVLLWPWPELQPEWVGRKFTDARWTAADDYKPGPTCWDHPQVRSLTERFVRTVVNRYKDHPSVLAWDLGAEAGIWVTSMGPVDQAPAARLYCYCPHTAARYRDWLKAKYGSIDKLNEVWATYYKSFTEVQPLRMGIFERGQIHWLDWREFMLANTTDFQRMKIETARQSDPNHPITAHIGAWGGGYIYSCTDEVGISRNVDVLGMSFFPFWFEYGLGWYDPSIGGMHLDGNRSSAPGKKFWVEEMQGGPSIFGLKYRSRFPTPEDIRLWCWQAVGHGVTGIFYWNWRPETTGIECGGFGLVDYDGSPTPWAEAAGEVGRQLQKHAKRFLDSSPSPAQIAIIHDPRTFIQAHGENNVGAYINSVRGLYRALFRANVPVDFVTPAQFSTTDLSRYKAIYLPFAYTMSREEARQLAAYVEGGGHLFAGVFCAFKDDRTFLYEVVPGGGLADVLHVRQSYVNPGGGKMKIVNGREMIRSLPVGTELPVHRYKERLTLLPGAEIVAEFDDKSPAVVAGRYGQGRTLYVGTMLCLQYDGSQDVNVRKFLVDFALAAGVQPPVNVHATPDNGHFEARVLEGPAGKTVILLNSGHEQITTDLSFMGDAGAVVSDLLTGEILETGADGNNLRLSLTMPGQHVRVLVMNK